MLIDLKDFKQILENVLELEVTRVNEDSLFFDLETSDKAFETLCKIMDTSKVIQPMSGRVYLSFEINNVKLTILDGTNFICLYEVNSCVKRIVNQLLLMSTTQTPMFEYNHVCLN